MTTRIQMRSRPTKRPMMTGEYNETTGAITTGTVPGRVPRFDKRGFPLYKGFPSPVLCSVTVVPVAVAAQSQGVGPTASSTIAEIKQWLDDRGIDYPESASKGVLLQIVLDNI